MPDQLDISDQTGALNVAFHRMGLHEREILCDVAQRLLQGQYQFGQFRDDDIRDFAAETYAELLDGIIYSARHLKRIA
jgi:hypothetical protein